MVIMNHFVDLFDLLIRIWLIWPKRQCVIACMLQLFDAAIRLAGQLVGAEDGAHRTAELIHVRTDDEAADIFTKALTEPAIKEHSSRSLGEQ